jgi:hypothetical protein
MFTSFSKKPFFNKAINEYCIKSTLSSIQNMIERQKKLKCFIYDDSKDKLKYSNSLILFGNPNPNNNPNNNPYIILAISIPLIYFFYQSGKKLFSH